MPVLPEEEELRRTAVPRGWHDGYGGARGSLAARGTVTAKRLLPAVLQRLRLLGFQFAQPRVDRRERVEIRVAGGLRELQLLDRGGQAALQ